MPTPDFRDATAEFIALWHTSANGVGAEAVAVVPVTKTKCEHGHRYKETVEIVWTAPKPPTLSFARPNRPCRELDDEAPDRRELRRLPHPTHPGGADRCHQPRYSHLFDYGDSNRIQGQGEYDCLLALGNNVASACSVYHWPQEKRAKNDNGKIGILHVKCAVANGHWIFLSSASFTEYAFTINMELGLLVTGGKLP